MLPSVVLKHQCSEERVKYRQNFAQHMHHEESSFMSTLHLPCGVIVNFTEMFTCELATQALYTTFDRNVHDFERLRYLGYDRACGFHPFLTNLEAKERKSYAVCRLRTPWVCPHLSAFTEIHGVNTECAEQAFKGLGRFKFHTRKMTID